MPVINIKRNSGHHDSIVVPSSILSVEPTLETKTMTASRIARIAGIFQLENILVYRNTDLWNYRVLCDILKFLKTPPYLRKYYKKKRTLRKIGLAYPLNIAIHKVIPDIHANPLRIGYILKVEGKKALVDVGLEKPVEIKLTTKMKPGTMILVDAVHQTPVPEDIYYTGYHVYCIKNSRDLELTVKKISADIKIGTSVNGKNYKKCMRCTLARKRVFFFGGPRKGVLEVYGENVFDEIINIMENQGTDTLRTEEAICIVLSRLS